MYDSDFIGIVQVTEFIIRLSTHSFKVCWFASTPSEKAYSDKVPVNRKKIEY
jgi:hypothetical protein